jgi:hypothetical protein
LEGFIEIGTATLFVKAFALTTTLFTSSFVGDKEQNRLHSILLAGTNTHAYFLGHFFADFCLFIGASALYIGTVLLVGAE